MPAKAARGLLIPGNIDLAKQPIVHNADGTTSTVRSMSFEDNGREILIPTVAHDGSRLLSEEEAIDQYRTTGRHLGIFDNPRNATAYAVQLHNDYANGKIPGYKADNSKGPDDLVSLLKPAGVLLGKAGEKVGKAVPGLLQKLAGRTNAR